MSNVQFQSSKYIMIFVPLMALIILLWSNQRKPIRETLSSMNKRGYPRSSVPVSEEPRSYFTETENTPEVRSPMAGVQEALENSRKTAITRAVRKVSPAVVGINVTSVKRYVYRSNPDPFFSLFFPPRVYEQEIKGLGSGFIISTDGRILTNEHVIKNAREIIITTPGGKKYDAEIIGSDTQSDIALLKIEGSNFPYTKLGNSDEVIIGEWVIALGNPFGLFYINDQPSVTVGVVSATNRDFGLQDDERVYQDMIQTDASINSGNSGGPLVNGLGDVIGMNTFIYSGSKYSQGSIGIGFAIPINYIKGIIPELEKYGRIDREFQTGIHFENIGRYIAYQLNLKSTDGVYVTRVDRNSSGEKAGIQVGDVILKINDQAVNNTSDVGRLLEVEDLRPGDFITLEIIRDGETESVKVYLEPRQERSR